MTNTITDAASSAYESISGSAQRVLPVASTLISEATGLAALTEDYSASPFPPAQPSSSCASSSKEVTTSTNPDQSSLPARYDLTEEQERGPSQPDRTSQPQKSIGTESGIPTTGGAATTVSPDDDVKAAISNEKRASNAAVGVDYSDQPCPTADARRPNPSSEPAEGKTQFSSSDEQMKGSSDHSSSATSGGGDSANRCDSTKATSSATGSDEQRSTAGSSKSSLTNKLRGSAKVVAGKITRDQEKGEQGKMLKAGGAQDA